MARESEFRSSQDRRPAQLASESRLDLQGSASRSPRSSGAGQRRRHPEPREIAAARACCSAAAVGRSRDPDRELSVHDGRVGLEDHSRPKAFATTLMPIEFTLTDFRTAPNFQNAYSFEASTLAGERFTWSGQFSVQPLGSTGQFAITDFKAATIAAYLQDALPFELPSGALDLQGEYRVALSG